MEGAMLQGLIQAIRKGLRADSSYKKEGWQMALDGARSQTNYPVSLKQIKSKHDVHKRDWKVWKDLCSQSRWGWDDDKGVPVASEDVMNTYFEANPDAARFRNAPPAYLEELEELFEGVIATGNLAVTVDEALDRIHNGIPIDPELLEEENAAAAPEDGIEEEVVDEDEALSSVEQRQLDSSASDDNSLGERSTTPSGQQSSSSASPSPHRTPSTTRARAAPLAIRKRAIERATRMSEEDAKRRRGKKRTADRLEESIDLVSQEIRATRELLGQKPPLETASVEFMKEFKEMDLDDQVLILQAFEAETTARSFLVTTGELRKRLINKILATMKKKEDVEVSGGSSN